jgi:hypothetical protein
MMTDTLLGWCIALALMLIPLEYSQPSTRPWPSILRGLLWSLVINIGLNSKVTFAFFVVVIGIALILIRERYSGEYPLRYAFFVCIAGCLPTIILWRFYGLNFLRFAAQVAWGDQARLWSVPGVTPIGYLQRYFSQLGFALIPLLALAALFIRGIIVQKQHRVGRLLPIGILMGYLGIAARSQNRDPRFAIPVMIAMPICLAWTGFREKPAVKLGVAPPITALVIAIAFCVPMVHRPELSPIRSAGELMAKLSQQETRPTRPIKVVIATDGPAFNIDSFLLARQVRIDVLQRVAVDTLVYDKVNKRTLQDGINRIDAADYVLFLRPGFTPGADWQRVWAPDYRAHCEAVGSLLQPDTSPEFEVFRIRSTAMSGIQ